VVAVSDAPASRLGTDPAALVGRLCHDGGRQSEDAAAGAPFGQSPADATSASREVHWKSSNQTHADAMRESCGAEIELGAGIHLNGGRRRRSANRAILSEEVGHRVRGSAMASQPLRAGIDRGTNVS